MSHRLRTVALGLLALAVFAPVAQAKHHTAKPKSKSKPVKAKAQKGFLLSLGDSYSVGWQVKPDGTQGSTLNGPADQLVPLAAKRGYDLKLVNLGCGGATTTSMLTAAPVGCVPQALAPNAANYPGKSQTQAAVDFIKAHAHQVKLVTISIGGNDVDTCPTKPDPTGCVKTAMPVATANLKKIVGALRAAGGADLRIEGSTYPDVELGLWVHPTLLGPTTLQLIDGSLSAFQTDINPGLAKAYASVTNSAFVDVTTATGAFGPFVSTTDPTYGPVPVPVEKVCQLTYFCSNINIHMKTPGYGIIAGLEAQALPVIVGWAGGKAA
jgi:lysophospholipase L1-like esterase